MPPSTMISVPTMQALQRSLTGMEGQIDIALLRLPGATRADLSGCDKHFGPMPYPK
jgi:hypothetical protein